MRFARVLFILVVLNSAAASAQETPAFGEQLVVHIVDVDVVVTRPDGSPVTGLSPDDFEIYENGERKEITHFEAVSIARATTGDSPRPARSAIFIIDNRALTLPVRKSLAKSISSTAIEMIEDDIAVMIIVLTSRAEVFARLTKDPAVIRTAAERLLNDTGLRREHLNAERRRTFLRLNDPWLHRITERERYRGLSTAMQALMKELRKEPSKKAVLFVSNGFSARQATFPENERTPTVEGAMRPPKGFKGDVPDAIPDMSDAMEHLRRPEIDASSDERWTQTADVVEAISRAANRERIAFYNLYAGGLEKGLHEPFTDMAVRPVDIGDALTSLNLIASDTGGIANGTSNVTHLVIDQARQDLNSYYALAYRTHTRGEFAARRIEVRLKNRMDYRLRYRRDAVLAEVNAGDGASN